jgi:hypothetical protein
MKCITASIIAVAGLTAAANATTTVNILVNGGNQAIVSANSGIQSVEVLVTVSTTSTSALGLGSMIFQPIVSRWAATDSLAPFTSAFGSNTSTPSGAVPDAPGSYGRISPFAAVNLTTSQRLFGHVHTSGSNGGPPGTFLRIAKAQVTNWIGEEGNTSGDSGVNIGQRSNVGRVSYDPAFLAYTTDVHVFRFALLLDTDLGVGRHIIVDAPLAGFGNLNTTTGNREVYWYADLNEVTGSVREVPTVVSGLIRIGIPTPASLALMSLGGIAIARRRR